MDDDMDTQLVIPCFNEQARLDLPRFRRLAEETGIHLLFVDDGSTDGTGRLLSEASEASPELITALRLERNAGKGEAVRQGLICALEDTTTTVVGFADADLATPEDELARLARMAGEHTAEVVLGSRVKLLGYDIQRNLARHYLGRVFATAASLTLKLPVYDTQCGAKFFRVTQTLVSALQRPFISPWVFDVELIGRLLVPLEPQVPPLNRDQFVEVPLRTWHDVPGSKLRAGDFFHATWSLVRIAHELRRRQRLRQRLRGAAGLPLEAGPHE